MRDERGQPMPQWFLDEPEVDVVGRWFLNSFWRLNTCRRYAIVGPAGGMKQGPIPWDAIQQYAERYRLDAFATHALARVVAILDDAFCKWHADNAPKPERSKVRER